MNKSLYVCNTVYQILVAMWIKKTLNTNSNADIIISNHMNGGKEICDRMRKLKLFDNCYFCETKEYSYGGILRDLSDDETSLLIHRHPEQYIKRVFPCECKYNCLFISNVDKFAQILFDACSRRVRRCKLYLFEDGISTYTKAFEECYQLTRMLKTDFIHQIVYKYIYNKRCIFGNVSGCYLFNPQFFDWSVDFPLIEMKKIDINDKDYVKNCNIVFDYHNQDKYDTKYIFMEESFFADGVPINDCEIVEEIARRVGKENIMVKIHPRNPINRFKELGFKTNSNMSVPWELIIMNDQQVCDSTFITIASSSVLNPILIFGRRIKVYSIYSLINEKSKKQSYLSTSLWDYVKKIFLQYHDDIHIVDCVDEIS